eukprot:Amastigsp_a678613_83.p2 type:complete len:148 gc:universal Amastigsp_a678613_83:54-497(+)
MLCERERDLIRNDSLRQNHHPVALGSAHRARFDCKKDGVGFGCVDSSVDLHCLRRALRKRQRDIAQKTFERHGGDRLDDRRVLRRSNCGEHQIRLGALGEIKNNSARGGHANVSAAKSGILKATHSEGHGRELVSLDSVQRLTGRVL